MTRANDILAAIFDAIDEVNQQLPEDQRLGKSGEALLTPGLSKLDSLGFINLVVTVEQNIQQSFDKTITLTNDEMFSESGGPFGTVQTLADHIALLLD